MTFAIEACWICRGHRRLFLVSALGVCLLGFAPSTVEASCGDYLHVAVSEPDVSGGDVRDDLAARMQFESRGAPSSPSSPCQGLRCERQRQVPAVPVPASNSVRLSDWAFCSEPIAAPSLAAAYAVTTFDESPTSGHPPGIKRPPRAAD
jgi:hypothetical protein